MKAKYRLKEGRGRGQVTGGTRRENIESSGECFYHECNALEIRGKWAECNQFKLSRGGHIHRVRGMI